VRISRGPDRTLLALFEDAGENVHRASLVLREVLATLPEQNGLGDEIVRCEHEGDRIAHRILCRLAERGARRAHMDAADIHALTVALDDVVDYAEEAADQLGRYGVEAPMDQAEAVADVLVAAASQVAAALRTLRDGGELAPILIDIHRLENQADQLVRSAVTSLFGIGIDPMMVIRWKDIFDSLEAAVDACETVANVLEGISLKRGARR
jgi:uncharacterized protein Yka (UPF0111/DUF47 family)